MVIYRHRQRDRSVKPPFVKNFGEPPVGLATLNSTILLLAYNCKMPFYSTNIVIDELLNVLYRDIQDVFIK